MLSNPKTRSRILEWENTPRRSFSIIFFNIYIDFCRAHSHRPFVPFIPPAINNAPEASIKLPSTSSLIPPLNLLWICSESALNLLWICSESALNLPWICLESALNLLRIFSESSLNLLRIFSESALKLLWNCSESIAEPAQMRASEETESA